ncbi:MAG: hypothetical protein K2Y23_01575 [Cyanobacteria bacterium]|nr:hypothetical protein [Cyanobacteriota bacterium]
MKNSSLWIIRLALTVQFLGVLAVPTIVFAADSPRALWMAEWLPALSERPASMSEDARESKGGRLIGVLKLRDNKLTFTEQIGQADWELDLARIKRVATVNGGRALLIVSVSGDEYIVSIMAADLTPGSAKRAISTIERALQLQAANGR